MPKKQSEQAGRPLIPDQIYRPREARLYFGYGATQLDEKIRAGEIPAPISLSNTGRAKGWLGRQILEWQAERVEAAAKRVAA